MQQNDEDRARIFVLTAIALGLKKIPGKKIGIEGYFFLILFMSLVAKAQAQIVPDATLLLNSTVTPQGNMNVIEGGTQAGGNLFHSFQEFSIPTGGTAFFNNAVEIENIFSRVTGNSISNIDGLIRANGFANLFLLNSNGIVFGPNAQLNIGGSFFASTANQINFADGSTFNTLPTETTPLLTVSVPVGLQMGVNPGKIVVQGPGNNISSDPTTEAIVTNTRLTGLVHDKTLALVGGEIELIGGNLISLGGQIELGSVGDNSTVSLTPTDKGWSFGYSEVGEFRDIELKAAFITGSGEGDGDIHLQGRSISLTEGSAIVAFAQGDEVGQNITLHASEQIELKGSNSQGVSSILGTIVFPGATGDAGNVTIETGQLKLSDGAEISSSTSGEGNGGNLTIRGSESVELTGFTGFGTSSSLRSEVNPGATGDANNLTIETGRLTLTDGAIISSSTLGQGNGGDLAVRATELVSLSGVNSLGTGSFLITEVFPEATGNAGNLTVETGRLTLADGAIISSSTAGQGNGGNLTVRVTESVELSGLNALGIPSGLVTGVGLEAIGDAGNVTVDTNRLTLADGAIISSSTAGQGNGGNLTVRVTESVELSGLNALGTGSLLLTQVNPGATGNAGNLTIETGRLTLTDGAFISSSTFGQGNGGDLTVRASESVSLSGLNGSGSSSAFLTEVGSQATGNAGNLTLYTDRLTLSDGAGISSSTFGQGNAGDLILYATSSVALKGLDGFGRGSALLTEVGLGANGDAGDLTIDTGRLTLTDGAEISSSTFSQGNGGNLIVRASESVTLSGLNRFGNGSILRTIVGSEATGNAGNITVETAQLTLSQGALISSLTAGQGNAGDLTVRASESVSLSGFNGSGVVSSFAASVAPEATGNAGNLTVKTRRFTLSDGAIIFSSTLGKGNGGNLTIEAIQLTLLDGASLSSLIGGQGNGGNLTIRASESMELSGLDSSGFGSNFNTFVAPEATGDAGNITIETGRLMLSEGAYISSSTVSQGNAGNLTVRASESVTLRGLNSEGNGSRLITTVEPQGRGDAGELIVETGQLTLSEGAAISSEAFGQGNGGNLMVHASESVTLKGLNGEGNGSSLETTAQVLSGGDAGDLTVVTSQLTMLDGAAIFSSTFGGGNGGNLTVRATELVSLSGLDGSGNSSSLETEASILSRGDAGNLTVETSQLILSDAASLSVSTLGQGNAGDLTVRASESVSLSGLNGEGFGSSFLTIVFPAATGDGGNLTVETDRLMLFDRALISSETFGDGNAGDVTIAVQEVTLRDGAQINVSALGDFSPGVLRVNADRVLLDNGSAISADIQSGTQGNIEISANSLFLRRNSRINTNATGPATGGKINIATGVLAALENSDISANSEQSQGGTVTIQAEGIFGTEFRQQASDATSDITATGADSSLSGTVSISPPEVDPTSGLVQLPENLADATDQLDSSCRPGRQQNEFIVTGRGGLPPSPMEAISDEATWLDLRPTVGASGSSHENTIVNPQSRTPQLVEAQGWVMNSKGQVELIAQASTATSHNPTVIQQQPCVAN